MTIEDTACKFSEEADRTFLGQVYDVTQKDSNGLAHEGHFQAGLARTKYLLYLMLENGHEHRSHGPQTSKSY